MRQRFAGSRSNSATTSAPDSFSRIAIRAQASKTKTDSAAKLPLLDLDLLEFLFRELFASRGQPAASPLQTLEASISFLQSQLPERPCLLSQFGGQGRKAPTPRSLGRCPLF